MEAGIVNDEATTFVAPFATGRLFDPAESQKSVTLSMRKNMLARTQAIVRAAEERTIQAGRGRLKQEQILHSILFADETV